MGLSPILLISLTLRTPLKTDIVCEGALIDEVQHSGNNYVAKSLFLDLIVYLGPLLQ